MSNMKFTPGPWVIDTDTRPAEVCTVMHVPDSESKDQGFVYVRGAVGYWGADEKENMANAHLIAAAPDMYEALSLAVEKLKEYAEADEEANGYGDGCFQRPDEFIEATVAKCSAALAKARGES